MTMLERVAVAISGAPFPTTSSLRKARAVLAAMREPTAEMEKAFYAACDEYGNVLWRYGYKAIIDAALEDKVP